MFVGTVLLIILVISQVQLRVGQMKTRDAQRKADTELVARALDQYFQVFAVFPPAADGQIVICGDILDLPCQWGKGSIRDKEGVTYLKQLPADPFSGQGRRYVYQVSSDRRQYRIYVALEYRRDPDWKTNLTIPCQGELQCNWYVGNH